MIYLSMGVIFASMAFWISGARSLARDLTDFVIGFSSYPGSVYTGATKLLVYSVFPAGFMVLAPVALLRHPDIWRALEIAAAAAGYAAAALGAFHLGLKRYRGGCAPHPGAS